MTVTVLPSLLSARDVQARLGCSRAEAYEHTAACAARFHGREPGRRGLLRVTREAWDRYEREVILCGSGSATTVRAGTSLSEIETDGGSSGRRAAPIVARRKRSGDSGSASSLIPMPQRYAPKR